MDDNLPDASNVLLKLQNNLGLVDATSGVCIAAFIILDKPPNQGASVGLLKKAWQIWAKCVFLSNLILLLLS